MRENWARLIVLITGVVVVILSMVFARIQNPESQATQKKEATIVTATKIIEKTVAVKGEQIFKQNGCGGCHSYRGEGNPRIPLDGVAKKYSKKEIQDWITGAETLEGQMTKGIMKIKAKYQKLPAEDLDTLVEFLRRD